MTPPMPVFLMKSHTDRNHVHHNLRIGRARRKNAMRTIALEMMEKKEDRDALLVFSKKKHRDGVRN
jgi:hypothetical protein